MTTTGALAGIRIVDLTRVLGGPYATQMLADHGAEVIKVEPPDGDETRGWGPPFREDGAASYFVGINRNKRGLALDLSRPAGREVLLRLLADADVLVENFKTGTLEKWDLGYHEVLKGRFPRLIHARISGFGDDGPLGGYPGYDAVVQAMAGVMSINGDADGEPVRAGVPIVDIATGMNIAAAILMALIERSRSGLGQKVETTLYDSTIAFLHPHAANYLMSGRPPRRTGNAHANIAPYDAFPTATVPVFLAIGNDRQFARLAAEIGAPTLVADPRFRSNAERLKHRDELREALIGALRLLDGRGLAARLLEQGVPAGAVEDIPAVLDHPHTRHRGMVVEEPGYRGTGIPVRMTRTPGSVRAGPPRLGADTRAVLAALGYGEAEIAAMIEAGIAVVPPGD
ncbi:MAG: CoA transferase [Hyphomicrobiaceae bacterium]